MGWPVTGAPRMARMSLVSPLYQNRGRVRTGVATLQGSGTILLHSPVAQSVERLTVNEAVSYGGKADVTHMAELIPSPAHRRGEGLSGSFHGKPWLTLRVNSGEPNPREGYGNPEPRPHCFVLLRKPKQNGGARCRD